MIQSLFRELRLHIELDKLLFVTQRHEVFLVNEEVGYFEVDFDSVWLHQARRHRLRLIEVNLHVKGFFGQPSQPEVENLCFFRIIFVVDRLKVDLKHVFEGVLEEAVCFALKASHLLFVKFERGQDDGLVKDNCQVTRRRDVIDRGSEMIRSLFRDSIPTLFFEELRAEFCFHFSLFCNHGILALTEPIGDLSDILFGVNVDVQDSKCHLFGQDICFKHLERVLACFFHTFRINIDTCVTFSSFS